MSGNKKKVVIKPWRPQSQWNRAKAEQTMEALRQAINEIHNQNASLLSFEELYRNAYYLVLHKYGRMLYDGVGEQIAAHLQETVKAIVAAPDDMLLAAVKRDWGAHTINMEMIRDILMYMDRTFVLKENLTKVYDLGLKTFRREVLHHKQVQNRLVKQILANIHSERCGELIDHALIKNIIDMLVHLGIDSREVYIDIFERPFLRDSAQFYSQESRDFILENTCPAYVAKAHARLKEEADRVTRCLHASTKRRLLEIVERELILQHAQTLVEMENSGCVAMFRDDKIQDLRDLYNLFLRVPKTLEIIMNALSSCIITTGQSLLDTCAGTGGSGGDEGSGSSKGTPLAFIEAVLAMREKYECICRDAFANNKEFQRTIKSAFEHFLNKGSRSAQFLCQYVDTMLKKTIKGMSEDEVESKLTKIIGIFRYLQDKDIFERFYKDYLSKRLLSGRTVSDDAERRMIGKLKTECGYQFTQQLEGMFTDIKNSHQVAESFLLSKYYDRDSGDVDFSVKVLTGGFWSAPPESECSLPPLIDDLMARFRKFYLEGHSGRRISLQCSMGTGSVQATFGGKRKELVVTTYQMCILMLFNEKETQTMAELQAATGISKHELKRHVVSLTLPKYRILKKEAKDTFSVNKGFKSKQFRIRIPLVTMRSSTREYAVPKKVLEDRRHAIEAAIVRVMKTRQTLGHNELIGEVTRQLSSRFSPNTSHIKKRIESLIEREYLERDGNDRKIYTYLA